MDSGCCEQTISFNLKTDGIEFLEPLQPLETSWTWSRAIHVFRNAGGEALCPLDDVVFSSTISLSRERWHAIRAALEKYESMTATLFRASGLIFGCPSPSKRNQMWIEYSQLQEALVDAGVAAFEYTLSPTSPWTQPTASGHTTTLRGFKTVQQVVDGGFYKLYAENDLSTVAMYPTGLFSVDTAFATFSKRSFGENASSSPSSSNSDSLCLSPFTGAPCTSSPQCDACKSATIKNGHF